MDFMPLLWPVGPDKKEGASMRLRKKPEPGVSATVQLRAVSRQPFGALESYVPLHNGEIALYRAVREAVPIVDAALMKIIRLVGGFEVRCANRTVQEELTHFLRTVPVGRAQRGLDHFLEQYLDSMLTCGRAVGEIVPCKRGGGIAAVLCSEAESVEVREGASPLEFMLCVHDETGALRPAPRQDLLLFTPFNPESGSPYGVSLLRSMPFLTEILLKIYHAIGQNWERVGNVHFAVIYKPEGDTDRTLARERSEQIAREWASAMESANGGYVRDFVAAGNVDIKVIGADNQVLDSEVTVRQILEQLIARTGIPPFMLGLNWSSTERMSSQQADMLTTEMDAIRRTLTPVVEKVCRMWLRAQGYACDFEVVWDTINLQDEVEDAKAQLYLEQARQLRLANDKEEFG